MWHHDVINELIKPMFMFTFISLAGLGWALAYQAFKENTILRKKLTNQAVDWILNHNSSQTQENIVWEHLTDLWERLKAFSKGFGRLISLLSSLTSEQWKMLRQKQQREQLKIKLSQIRQSEFLKKALVLEPEVSHLGGSNFTVKEPELKLVRLIYIWYSSLEALGRSKKQVIK